MSRNLCTDTCVECNNYTFGIADMVGKPIEFRQYSFYNPNLGCRLDCPECGRAYFAWVYFYDPTGAGHHPPDYPGSYRIDLSFYESYNDEPDDDNINAVNAPPRYVVTEDTWNRWSDDQVPPFFGAEGVWYANGRDRTPPEGYPYWSAYWREMREEWNRERNR